MRPSAYLPGSRALGVVSLVAVTLLLALPASAATKTWSATPADGNWSNASNWVGSVAPVAGDDLVFPSASTTKATTNDLSAGISISSLTFSGNGYSIAGNQFTLGASGASCTTAASPQTNYINADVALGATPTFTTANGCEIHVQSIVSGAFGLTKAGTGNLMLGGANTFSGPVAINAGSIFVEHNQALGTADGTSGTGTILATGGTLSLSNGRTITGEYLSVQGTGVGGGIQGAFYCNAPATWTGPVVLTGDVSIGTAASTLTISGPISGGFALTTLSIGNLVLSGTNTYTGATTIGPGTLTVNGSLATSGVQSQASSTLAGSGTISNGVSVASAATVGPGQSPGQLSTGSVTFSTGSTFAVELNGTTVGSQYDQLNVTGSVALGGATLTTSLGFVPPAGTTFVIIQNDGADAVTGTFSGLPEKSTVTVNNVPMTLSYVGGDGNDVTLSTAAAVPTMPLPWLAALAGLLLLVAAGQLKARVSSNVPVRID